ncbi:MAG: hypothetical protein LBI10_08480 [Deltaproteobacteria bacterium]|nr:hypothetical protein [Deltaproteobacteria bacterium]
MIFTLIGRYDNFYLTAVTYNFFASFISIEELRQNYLSDKTQMQLFHIDMKNLFSGGKYSEVIAQVAALNIESNELKTDVKEAMLDNFKAEKELLLAHFENERLALDNQLKAEYLAKQLESAEIIIAKGDELAAQKLIATEALAAEERAKKETQVVKALAAKEIKLLKEKLKTAEALVAKEKAEKEALAEKAKANGSS